MENEIVFIEVYYNFKYYYGFVSKSILAILDGEIEIKKHVFKELLKTGVFKIKNTDKNIVVKKIKI